jgi:hypothetical protein
MKGSFEMANNVELSKEGLKAWKAPELRRLRAGAAETNGTQNIPDGGPPGNARS